MSRDARIKNKTSLGDATGLSTKQRVGKRGTRVIKPAGLCTVMAGCEETFMAPLPIRLLPGIDYKIIQQLYQFNLRYINEIHRIRQEQLHQAARAFSAGQPQEDDLTSVIGKINFEG